MRQAWVLATVVLCALSIGCGGGGGDDGPGDSCPAFVRIVDGTFNLTATELTWTLEVDDIPATLTFDQTDVVPNVLEYAWGVDVDTDGDGMENWEISASHFRFDGPEKELPPLMGTMNALWEREGAAGVLAGPIDITLSGTTFTFVVPVDEEPGLADITESSQMVYFTHYQYGRTYQDNCTDMMM